MSKPPAKKAATTISRGAPEDYNAVAARAQLRGVKLASTSFDLKPEALGSDPNEWSYAIKSEMADCEYFADSGHLYCVYRFTAVCRKGRTRMLGVDSSYIVTFHVDGPCNTGSARAYAAILGRVAAYPHYRSLFATLSSQAGIMLPPLPIMSEQPRRVDKVLQSFGDPADHAKETASS